MLNKFIFLFEKECSQYFALQLQPGACAEQLYVLLDLQRWLNYTKVIRAYNLSNPFYLFRIIQQLFGLFYLKI